jgi:hypothetical protein
MGPELYEQVLWLNTLNTTLLPVQEEMNVLRLQAINYGFELPLTVVNETLSGTLWLYPTAVSHRLSPPLDLQAGSSTQY